jgi:hypothetical protein
MPIAAKVRPANKRRPVAHLPCNVTANQHHHPKCCPPTTFARPWPLLQSPNPARLLARTSIDGLGHAAYHSAAGKVRNAMLRSNLSATKTVAVPCRISALLFGIHRPWCCRPACEKGKTRRRERWSSESHVSKQRQKSKRVQSNVDNHQRRLPMAGRAATAQCFSISSPTQMQQHTTLLSPHSFGRHPSMPSGKMTI